MSEPGDIRSKIDARALICQDLQDCQQDRRRHFLPALLLISVGIVGMGVFVGVRPNLLEQPIWQLALQIVLWLLCLVGLPGIGLGLFFPTRGARVAIASGSVILTVAASLGWPLDFSTGEMMFGGCAMMVAGYTAFVLILGLFSGAFAQRRRSSAVYWVAAGIALTALNAVTWHCPATTNSLHIGASHLGVAAVFLLLVSITGVLVHRRGRPD